MLLQNHGILNFSGGKTYSQILADGLTAAWYCSDEPSTVIKSAITGDQAIGWGDKLTYSEGLELIDQNNWYKLSYWSSPGASWSQSGTTLRSNGTGSCNKLNFWQIGHTYKVTITKVHTSGEIRPLNDNTHASRLFSGSDTYTYFIPCSNTQLYNYGAAFVGTITAMSIKEVPANTLVQFDVPNGYRPLWSADGIAFDGTNDFLKTSPFSLAQPEMIYAVMKQVTWTKDDYLFDGNATNGGKLTQDTATPKIGIYSGAYLTGNANLAVNTWGIVRALFSGASSSLQVNETAALTGNAGTAYMGGFTIGARGAGDASFGRITAKEIIIRKAYNAADDAILYAYLKAKYSL